MRIFLFILLKVLVLETLAQTAGLKWYKGNTHTHSYWSDGDDFRK